MTDKPFDHEEYSRERLQQTTPGDGSDFKGPLVHKPGRIEADQQTIAELRAETERWQEFANGYMRDLTAAEQTIAELRKALEEARPYIGRLAGGQHVGKVLSQGEAVKLLGRINALAAIAATPEREAIVHDDSGQVALCLRCGFVTWHEKDGEVQHEPTCAIAATEPS